MLLIAYLYICSSAILQVVEMKCQTLCARFMFCPKSLVFFATRSWDAVICLTNPSGCRLSTQGYLLVRGLDCCCWILGELLLLWNFIFHWYIKAWMLQFSIINHGCSCWIHPDPLVLISQGQMIVFQSKFILILWSDDWIGKYRVTFHRVTTLQGSVYF